MTENRLAKGSTGAHPPPPAAQPADTPVIDGAVIEQLASITNSEGRSVLSELLHAFLGAVPTRLDALDRAVASGDLAAVALQAHALTGSSASFGARGMATLCRRLRVAAEEGDAPQSRVLVGSLHAEYRRVRESLMTLLGDGA
jgi:HPt (histidine-containing phosphotransfer) domain-containing protein